MLANALFQPFAHVVGALPAGQRRLVLRPRCGRKQLWRPTHAKKQTILSAWRATTNAFVDVCDVKVRQLPVVVITHEGCYNEIKH